MHSQIDLVILGGGCAGLSLASRLSAFGKDAPSVLIIEQRENYTNDRTWCFWDIEHPAYKQQANHAWTSFEISNQQRTHQFDCRKHQYLMLESHTFYQDALTTIEQNPNVELLLGQQVI
ncbi:MAG: lycopene cyclase family protein, partial [Methylophilaceae bacterium]|nr:lycopene cyclase family protein [Methylophilaceae bacterium]